MLVLDIIIGLIGLIGIVGIIIGILLLSHVWRDSEADAARRTLAQHYDPADVQALMDDLYYYEQARDALFGEKNKK